VLSIVPSIEIVIASPPAEPPVPAVKAPPLTALPPAPPRPPVPAIVPELLMRHVDPAGNAPIVSPACSTTPAPIVTTTLTGKPGLPADVKTL
jgi:hypothetical protein